MPGLASGWNVRAQFESDDLVAQVEQALVNVVAVLRAAGAGPEHLARMTGTSSTRRPICRDSRKSARSTGESSADIIRR
jgi:hypothetical protein